MGWGEALRLLHILMTDPTSAVASHIAGWEHPISREALVLMDHYDLTMAINHDRKKGKAPTHPGRPSSNKPIRQKRTISREAARKALRPSASAPAATLPRNGPTTTATPTSA